jgi:type VI secretion system ImpA family protein
MRIDREAFSAPIPGEEPSGAWLRREGTYAAVQEAMRADPGDPSYGIPEKRADWHEVVSLCSDALISKSKDFYLACCLLEGLAHTEGVAGLADALWFIAELHERFWEDFHPRPRDEGTNLDARLNQLDVLSGVIVNSDREPSVPGRALIELPVNPADEPWRLYAWAFDDSAPPGADEKREAVRAAPWDFYDEAARCAAEAEQELRRLDDLLDHRYGGGAPSLAPAKELLAQVSSIFAELLREKGPSPYEQQARQVLEQTRCGFLDPEWLAQKVRADVPTPRMLGSLQAAVVDDAAGLAPEEGWQAHLEGCWERGERYEQRAEDVPPAATATPMPPVAAPGATAVVVPAPIVGDAPGTLIATCRAMRAADPGDPVPYVVLRYVRWRELERYDASSTPPAPPAGMREKCQALFDAERWVELLDLCEQTLEAGEAVAWLDLQRYACAALGQAGLPHRMARSEVVRVVGELVRRHAWLKEVELADGRPAADETTLNWLSVEGGAAPEPGATEGVLVEGERDDSELPRAVELLEAEGLDAAIQHLQVAADGARSARQRALRHQELGQLLLRAERADLAVPVLERLRAELRTRELEEWEGPDFLGRALEALYRSYTLMEISSPTEDVAARKREVADELAQVDLGRRLRLDAS